MLTVYKYQITPDDKVELKMPRGSKILTVQTQFDEPQLWALVDTDAEIEKRIFLLAGTGHKIKESRERMNYINTFQISGGHLVFHLFEITEN